MKFYVIFSNPLAKFKHVGASIIRTTEKTSFTHVAILCAIGKNKKRWIVFESVYPKARSIMLDDWLKEYTITETWSIDVKEPLSLFLLLTSKLHKKYSIFQLIAIFMNRAFGFVTKVFNGSSELICTELVYYALDFCFDLSKWDDRDMIGLKDIERIIDYLSFHGLATGVFNDWDSINL